jgi:hypothetical protein
VTVEFAQPTVAGRDARGAVEEGIHTTDGGRPGRWEPWRCIRATDGGRPGRWGGGNSDAISFRGMLIFGIGAPVWVQQLKRQNILEHEHAFDYLTLWL